MRLYTTFAAQKALYNISREIRGVLPLHIPADAHVIIIIMKLQNDETRNDSITRCRRYR